MNRLAGEPLVPARRSSPLGFLVLVGLGLDSTEVYFAVIIGAYR